jgi:hypothetical protein
MSRPIDALLGNIDPLTGLRRGMVGGNASYMQSPVKVTGLPQIGNNTAYNTGVTMRSGNNIPVRPMTNAGVIAGSRLTMPTVNTLPVKQPEMRSGMSGLLGETFSDPRTYGLLGASAKMLEQSGYSTTPRTFGQIVGSGINAGLANYAQANKMFNRPKLQVVGGALIDTSDPNNPKVVYDGKSDKSNVIFNKETGQLIDISDPNNPKVTNIDGIKIPPKTPKIGEAQKSIDREFGKEYSKFVISGGASSVGKNISQLQDATNILQKHLDAGNDLTGDFRSILPESLRSFANPEGVKIQQMVEEVVQSNLKAVLGAQFTEREAQQLLARTFNPKLLPEENIRRIQNLQKSIELAFQQKLKAVQYFEENGTISGFKGASSITLDQIKKNFETLNQPNKKLKIRFKNP